MLRYCKVEKEINNYLIGVSQYGFGDFLARDEIVVTIRQNFWFDNGYDSVGLTDGRVTS